MTKDLKVMTKLVAILVAPVLVLVAFAVVGVRQRQADAARAQHVLALTDFVGASRAVLEQVELEGLLAARVSGTPVGGEGAVKAEYAEQQPKTDAAVVRFRDLATGVDDDDSPAFTASTAQVNALAAGLGTTRSSVTGRSIEATQIVDENYQNVSNAIVEVIENVGESVDEVMLSRRMASVASLARLGAAHSHAANVLAVAAEVGYFPARQPKISQVASAFMPPEFGGGCGNEPAGAQAGDCLSFESLRLANREIESNEKAFSAIGSPDDQPLVRRNAQDAALDDYVKKAIEMGEGKDPTYRNDLSKLVPPAEFATAARQAIDGYSGVTATILSSADYPDSVASIASARVSEAQQAVRTYLFFVVGSIAVAALVTLAVGRSISVPRRPRGLVGRPGG
jgi:hypothetical protein